MTFGAKRDPPIAGTVEKPEGWEVKRYDRLIDRCRLGGSWMGWVLRLGRTDTDGPECDVDVVEVETVPRQPREGRRSEQSEVACNALRRPFPGGRRSSLNHGTGWSKCQVSADRLQNLLHQMASNMPDRTCIAAFDRRDLRGPDDRRSRQTNLAIIRSDIVIVRPPPVFGAGDHNHPENLAILPDPAGPR